MMLLWIKQKRGGMLVWIIADNGWEFHGVTRVVQLVLGEGSLVFCLRCLGIVWCTRVVNYEQEKRYDTAMARKS